ncbi:hypothetical protein K438DRAFT_822379 [Mycena galopus ATCC 62051]|nr:hypothetical protein K438DRAFT_822379 [Mycena galopus ATCC 62051]
MCPVYPLKPFLPLSVFPGIRARNRHRKLSKLAACSHAFQKMFTRRRPNDTRCQKPHLVVVVQFPASSELPSSNTLNPKPFIPRHADKYSSTRCRAVTNYTPSNLEQRPSHSRPSPQAAEHQSPCGQIRSNAPFVSFPPYKPQGPAIVHQDTRSTMHPPLCDVDS